MRLSSRLVLIAMYVAAPLAAQPPAPPSSDADLALAMTRLRERRFAEARTLLARAAAAEPTPPDAPFYLGRLALRANAPAEAVTWLERAVALDPARSAYHQYLGRAYAQDALAGSKLRLPFVARRAKRELERAVALDPENVSARQDLGQYYLAAPGLLGGSRSAAAAQVTEIARRNAMRGHIARATVAAHVGDTTTATAELRAATQVAPDSAAAHGALGDYLRTHTRYAEARASFEEAARLGDRSALFEIGRVAVQENANLPRGEAALRQYLAEPRDEEEPTEASAHLWLARLLERANRGDEAAAEYRAVLAVEPTHAAARSALGRLTDRRRP